MTADRTFTLAPNEALHHGEYMLSFRGANGTAGYDFGIKSEAESEEDQIPSAGGPATRPCPIEIRRLNPHSIGEPGGTDPWNSYLMIQFRNVSPKTILATFIRKLYRSSRSLTRKGGPCEFCSGCMAS